MTWGRPDALPPWPMARHSGTVAPGLQPHCLCPPHVPHKAGGTQSFHALPWLHNAHPAPRGAVLARSCCVHADTTPYQRRQALARDAEDGKRRPTAAGTLLRAGTAEDICPCPQQPRPSPAPRATINSHASLQPGTFFPALSLLIMFELSQLAHPPVSAAVFSSAQDGASPGARGKNRNRHW